MALKRVTLRFSPGVLEAIELEAAHAGISAAEFIRAAAIARSAFTYARRGGEGVEILDRMFAVADDMVRAWPDPPEE